MPDLTRNQISEVRMMLRVLRKAIEGMMDMSEERAREMNISVKDRRYAIDALIQARLRLEKLTYELEAKVLLLHVHRRRCEEIKKILHSILPHENRPLLNSLGRESWEKIETTFSAAGVECPLAIRIFHAAYQEELSASSPGELPGTGAPLPPVKVR